MVPINLGHYSEGGTPVPIPNTEVKPFSAHGTSGLPWWESRSWPSLMGIIKSKIFNGGLVRGFILIVRIKTNWTRPISKEK